MEKTMYVYFDRCVRKSEFMEANKFQQVENV